MKITHNIVHAENYTKNGEEKTRWHNIGVLLQGEKNGKERTVIKLTCMPLTNDGFFNCFPYDPEHKGGKTSVDEAREILGAGEDNGDEPINLDNIPF